MPPPSTLIQVARPIFKLDGSDNAELAQGLLRLEVLEGVEGLKRCEATFGNWGAVNGNTGFLYFDRSTLDFGKRLEVLAGADSLFKGKITALEGSFPEGAPPDITVLAEDGLQDLRMTRRTRTFADLSDADVVRQIANDHGLTPDVSITGPSHRVLAQTNQSDLAFLRDRCRSNGVELWIRDTTLHAAPRRDRSSAEVELSYGQDLLAFSVLADLATQRTSVTCSGWDVAGKASLTQEATDSLVQNELNGGTGGSSLLRTALAERKEALVHTSPLNASEARAIAESYYRMIARRFVVGRGTARGRGDLQVGTVVNLAGLGPLFSGKYHLTEVRHLFDSRNGYRVEFTAERPALGQPR